ncbi:pentatricopeptide repeat-containing protein At4g19191, mitochondrial-like [Mercurialis annua]|uniref:pentatricopeptide repeat-containing protein At4g19191, mitochondrial-like n=1 Tax=Mercurialis annua TaxID=3986 RepID=UPI00216094CF|nr:pentatricopeptide repeat-containing protein At4g19191, mitochondrial-like [Mercurialis annua]XP_055959849.1 pentatricopeptide repeat-containing protein At4g19191, mitochondrial-like [Mercurialis annua]
MCTAGGSFSSVSDRSCVTWTAIISGYAEKGNMEEALKLFNAMGAAGEKPDLITVLSVISGCGQTGVLEIGKWIDAYADSNCLKHNAIICNALIDMYAKCGNIDDAWYIFTTMPDRTVVTWTTMIAGCALGGLFEVSLDLFNQMVYSGLKPNHITFLSVLQACTHGGFLEKGWECFNMMTEIYKINPGLDHYSCMVDLLGRKGKIKEAFEFVQAMPIKPDAAIWSSLLSSCKIYQNVQIGEYAAHRVIEMEPHVSYPYVALANIYASAGRWNGVARIRTMMKNKRVIKSPGQSLLEINGKTHAFTVEDRGHYNGELIYDILDCLVLQSKDDETSQQLDSTLEHVLESIS